MLCERCQKRDATTFLTTCICGDDPRETSTTSRSLCAECCETDQPEAFANIEADKEAGCRYCGTKCGGATFCHRCLKELRRIKEVKGLTFEGEATREQREERVKIIQEIEEHMAEWVLKRGPADFEEPEDLEEPEGPSSPRDDAFKNLAEADPRFTIEAYRFVADATSSAVERVSPDARVHVSARDVCEAFRTLARLRYGKEALPTLQAWGIHSTDDIGAVVFRMIEARIFGARPEDKLEDFHALYDFGSAFPVA
jgi:uncharacterized repeat protein (TIGR04138 family)